MEIDNIYNMDCLEGMKQIPDGTIDLTVTSPPYDNLRDYHGYSFDFENVARELYRITKDGGVVVWIVNDATINGSETGTSFRQALFFKDCGFNLHDTMIWAKDGGGAIGSNLCYTQNFEYMFVLSKGRPKSVTLIYDKPNGKYGMKEVAKRRRTDGTLKEEHIVCTNEYSRRNNWWRLVPQRSEGSEFHPAVFPEKLVRDHIYTWSQRDDVVLDPFMGSGTTAIACIKERRHFIGFELSKEYFDKAVRRIKAEQA